MRAIIALGGNAILRKGQRGAPEEQWATVRLAASRLAPALSKIEEVIVTHGNGPQVGYLMEAFEALPPGKPRQSLDIAVAMTQGWLGYLLAHALEEATGRRAAAVVTRVEVDPSDPAFSNPTKFIGSYYTREEAEELARRYGWVFKEDPRGGYRRVVPSPRPLRVLEADVIERLASEGVIVVAVGGGGVPVARSDGGYKPVEAVIDKDLASARLALQVDADRLVILTDVPGVALNYGRPGERWMRTLRVDEARRLLERGEFPPGSMGPKVEAAVMFTSSTCKPTVIGSLDEAELVVDGRAGTLIEC